MTTQPQTPWTNFAEAAEAFGQALRTALADMAFQLAAQGALGACLRGEPHDPVHTRLTTLTTPQLEQVNRAARTLTTLTDAILEDREIAADIDAATATQADIDLLRHAAEKARLNGDTDHADKFAMAADDHESGQCSAGDEPCVALADARNYLAAQNAETPTGRPEGLARFDRDGS